ncbi:MAG TPA: hypothetical protein VKE49_12020 [Myxococcaceae bacterium]|nr:hypothetical protein [Myxococcaceae bacterium]
MSDARWIRRRRVSAAGLAMALGGLAVIVFSLSAAAYILPPGSILRRLSEARDELQLSALRVDGTITFAGSAASEAASAFSAATVKADIQADAALLLKMPGRCRWEVAAPTGGKTAAVWSHGKRRTEGPELAPMIAALDQICPILAARSSSEAETRAAIERHLRSLKIDTRTTSLARLAGQVAYVLGNPADAQPQFWIYKDTFLPARVRWSDPTGGAYDARFIDYGSPVSGDVFPRVTELYQNNELAIRFIGLKSDVRAQLSDKLF